MKKLFISLCVALMGLCASAQQKGDMAVGLNLGVAPCLESGLSVTNVGIGAKFQYNVTDPIRLEADVDYWLKDKGMDLFDVTVNAHYLFTVAERFKVYPLVGIGFGRAKIGADFDIDYHSLPYDNHIEGSVSASSTKFLANIGIGAEYPVTDKLSIGAEIKYQYIKDFCRLPISVGATYKF